MKFYHIFYTCAIWIELTEYIHENLLTGSEFCENWCSESDTFLRGINEFLSLLATLSLLSNLGENMHIMLLSVYDSCILADRKPYFSYEHK
jgi:hypothetical protein